MAQEAYTNWASSLELGSYERRIPSVAIDSDGYGTFVNVVAGSKWWIVARPKDGLDVDVFNTTSIWLDEEFDIDKSCEKLFDVEAILLQPGSELWVCFFNFFPCYKLMLFLCQQYHAAQYTSRRLHT